MSVIKMTDLDLAGKRVLIRQDLNVPIKDGKVTSDKRILASLPTIEHAMNAGAKVMVMSHLGRPSEGEYDEQFSLIPVGEHMAALLGHNVEMVKDWVNGVGEMQNGEVVLCENVRFNKGEKKNDEELSKKMAALCDIFVMDAFGTAHRAQASTHGVAKYAPVACAGPLLAGELEALGKALDNLIVDRTTDPIAKNHRAIRVLVSYNATNYFVVKSQQKGLEYELMENFAKDLNKHHKQADKKRHMIYISVPFNQLIPSLLAGKGDIIAAGLTVTPWRAN